MKNIILFILTYSILNAFDAASYKETDVKLVNMSSNIIAIVTQTDTYNGGAHGYSTNYYQNYDKNDGSLLTWKALFNNNNNFFDFIYKQIKNKLVNKDYIESFSTQEQVKRLSQFKKIGNFSIKKEGLYIEFPLYTIAPYVYGHKALLIEKEILKKYMDKEAYKYYFLLIEVP